MSLLHRQVPSYLKRDNREPWVAFKPTPRDEGWLSVSCAALCSPEVAFARYIARKKPNGSNLQSDGVLSVSRDECGSLALPVRYTPRPDDDAHHEIGFTHLDEAAVMESAIALHTFARARGWQYQPGGAP